MKKKSILIFAILLLSVLAVSCAGVSSEAPVIPPGATPSDNQVNSVAKNMYCPVCENTPLDVCGTVACAQWREEIRIMLGEGSTPAEIYDRFQLKYGDRVLASPPAEGFNWVLYLVPPTLILIAGFFFVKVIRENRSARMLKKETKSEKPIVDSEVLSDLDRELAERDN